jgi:flagellin
LQVADGALSQVTSLLNRAVTLATEASNGTLNTTQDAAANQEYQSILSEISNIGSTTTYNQEAVFGSNTNIYTGDSSSKGASINDLSIGSLSSSQVGQTGGTMGYSSGTSVFIDMSASGKNAQSTDSITAGSSLNVTYVTGQNATSPTVGTMTATGGTLVTVTSATNDTLTGSITYAGNTYVMGSGTNSGNTIYTGGNTLQSLATAIGSSTPTSGTFTSATVSGNGLVIVGTGLATTVTSNLVDHSLVTASTTVTDGGTNTVAGMIAAINASGLGLTASFTTAGAAGASGTATDTGIMISGNVTNATPTSVGQSEVAQGTTALSDTTTAETTPTVASGSSGIATISYTASAGANLQGTSLTNQTSAEAALTALNAAISDVAAQDGYVGAQINTLNSASQVLSTQQENVQSAQNAVQATDYAQASSNMSKYEILSQTGISALAQANSVQQEVTKLLQ